MNALRNVSGQPLLIHKTGGAVVHVLPGRAVALTDEELNSSQVRSLIAGGLGRTEKIGSAARAAGAAKAEPARQEPEKREARERQPEKKKDES
ncbi:MAG TPA: hypothetical protein VMU60_10055 [Syntrophobacteria bacterium]|nr:hypothetical protein [Syntrophobacteria bacterium]